MSSHSMRIEVLRSHAAPQSAVKGVWATVQAMVRARHTRKMLRDMDDRLLADIGIGRGDALMEAARPMWDLHRAAR